MKLQRDSGKIRFANLSAGELLEKFGSPLYLYEEDQIRKSCRTIKKFCANTGTRIYYSAKANSNLRILQIIRSEGLRIDAMSFGEVFLEEKAGFSPEEMMFLTNNASEEVFQKIGAKGIPVCVDAVSQLERYCKVRPGTEVHIRLNAGKGAGHHKKVITVGKVKFGVDLLQVEQCFSIAKEYGCKIVGFVIHIGSSYADYDGFHEGVSELLKLAEKYPEIESLDFGGGFAIAYDREKEKSFDFENYEPIFTKTLKDWQEKHGRKMNFSIEPGRFLVAESAVCLTRVMSVKNNYGVDFVGCDMGFNTLLRPAFYDAFHEIVNADRESEQTKIFDVTGNLCESGDILGKERALPVDTQEGDVLIVRDTGAYAFAMSSNYNGFPRPAEVLLNSQGEFEIIRRKETLEDLILTQVNNT